MLSVLSDLGRLVMQLKKYEFSINIAPGTLQVFLSFSFFCVLVALHRFPQLSSVSCVVLCKNNSRSLALLFIKKLIALLKLTEKHSFSSLR